MSFAAEVQGVVVDRAENTTTVHFGTTRLAPLEPDELLVRPAYVGICGSDLEIVRGGMPETFHINYPHTMGHEWSGTVESVGSAVSEFRAGDRVLGHGHLGGNDWFGVTHDGAAQELFTVPARMCFAVPDGVDMLTAAIIEPFACVLQGLRRIGRIDSSDTVHVYGLGAIGLAGVLQAVVAGARVVAIDPSPLRRDIALTLGASLALDPGTGTAMFDECEAALGRRHADVVLEASGAPSAQASALESADQNARVLFMGLSRPRPEPTRIGLIQERNLTVSASTGAPVEIWGPAIRYVAQAKVDLGVMVSSVLPFEQCAEAFQRAANSREEVKVMLVPSSSPAL